MQIYAEISIIAIIVPGSYTLFPHLTIFLHEWRWRGLVNNNVPRAQCFLQKRWHLGKRDHLLRMRIKASGCVNYRLAPIQHSQYKHAVAGAIYPKMKIRSNNNDFFHFKINNIIHTPHMYFNSIKLAGSWP